jgi:hypothetical protein
MRSGSAGFWRVVEDADLAGPHLELGPVVPRGHENLHPRVDLLQARHERTAGHVPKRHVDNRGAEAPGVDEIEGVLAKPRVGRAEAVPGEVIRQASSCLVVRVDSQEERVAPFGP